MDITPPRGSSYPSAMRNAEAQEREAERRIYDAERKIQDAARFAQISEERIKQQHETQDLKEAQRHEESLLALRGKYEEELRKLQNDHHAELSRIRREAESELAQVQNYYSKSTYETEQRGKHQLQEIQNRNHLLQQHEARTAKDEIAEQKTRGLQELQELQTTNEKRYTEELESAHLKHEALREQSEAAGQRSEAHFKERFEKTVARHDEQINRLNQESAEKLRQMREDTSRKLSAYSSRQKDPFYRMVDLEVELREESDHYVVTARVPEHERDGISVALKGNQLVVAGHRRNEERQETSPGHSRTTASFQSFQESIPLEWPVEGRKLERRFEDDRLIVTIPKLNHKTYRSYSAKENSKAPPRIRAEKPRFPENLAVAEKRGGEEDGDRPPSTKTPGSRPLG